MIEFIKYYISHQLSVFKWNRRVKQLRKLHPNLRWTTCEYLTPSDSYKIFSQLHPGNEIFIAAAKERKAWSKSPPKTFKMYEGVMYVPSYDGIGYEVSDYQPPQKFDHCTDKITFITKQTNK